MASQHINCFTDLQAYGANVTKCISEGKKSHNWRGSKYTLNGANAKLHYDNSTDILYEVPIDGNTNASGSINKIIVPHFCRSFVIIAFTVTAIAQSRNSKVSSTTVLKKVSSII